MKPLKSVGAIPMRSFSTALAVSAIALLPVLSWQAIDGHSSPAEASREAVTPVAAQSIIGKSSLTWEHLKSDRQRVRPNVQTAVFDDGQTAEIVEVVSLDTDDAVEPQSEAATISVHTVDVSQFSDWLEPSVSGEGKPRIVDFSSRKTHGNRKACRANHQAIVNGFEIENARIMADKPVLFQSRICAANGEIVITCFGTTATVSPRKNRPGGQCSRNG